MASVIRVCQKCGAKIFSDAPEGLCTGCVLETALGGFPDVVAGVDDPGASDNLARNDVARYACKGKSPREPLSCWEN